MDDELGLDLRGEPPRPRWTRNDIAWAVVLAVGLALMVLCALTPVGDPGGLDDANVDYTRIVLAKLAERLDALPEPPADTEAFVALAVPAELNVDAWGEPIRYARACVGGNWRYTLVSFGKDGKPGGEGPSADLSREGFRATWACSAG